MYCWNYKYRVPLKMRKFLNALTKKLISVEMQLTGEKCKPSKMQTLFLRTTNPSIREPSIINIIGVWSIFVVLWQSVANFLFMDHLEIFPDFNPPFCCCSLRMIISSIMDGLQTFLQNVFLSFLKRDYDVVTKVHTF